MARKSKSQSIPSGALMKPLAQRSPRSMVQALQRRADMQAASGVAMAPETKSALPPVPEALRGRKGRKGVVVYLSPAAKDQLDLIAFENKKTVQSLGVDAVNALFRSYGKLPIA